jgi:hypothetical protein
MNQLKETLRDIKARNEVSLDYFLRFSESIKDLFEDVLRSILSAFGIDSTSNLSRISFDTFVKIKCFLQFNNTEKKELARIWLKILNPAS